MPKMIVSIDGVVIKEVQLTKDRTTLGRRPYNDIVIDNLAISGEHAVFQMTGNEVFIEDLNSTNGTYVNGKAAKKQLLQPMATRSKSASTRSSSSAKRQRRASKRP
jgi:pSer/pThr/pTyr-binding forkhead associated (FHA) protein